MRVKKLIIILIIATGLLSLDRFNPGPEDFISYIKSQIERAENTKNNSYYQLFVGLSDEARTTAIEQGVWRRDYVFFSIFEVLDRERKSVHKVLGVAKKIFIPLNELPNREKFSIY